ncbi:alanine racemase [uncultured Erythrobacter sp.]|uniref:alanine racemase n=1 Tax=uncultured Erythrobacter sp. TaxID=263913 RepID=UPI0026171061|nr:alanine racemase [uncultured Erythrobacter sp.]
MKSPAEPAPTHRLRVDTEALAHNWLALDGLSRSARAGAAVKADCYGLGVDTCLPVLRDAGCHQFFVAHWSEVDAVARYVPTDQIAVLHGPMRGGEVDYARACGAVPVINSLRQAELWSDAGGGLCHLMVDTGMNRLGVSAAELSDARVQVLEVDMLMSHLACADEDSAMNAQQLSEFREAIDRVEHRRLSLANSAGIALGSDYAFDVTRPGLSLYGGVPRPELHQHIRQVAFLEAAIIQCRELNPGDRVGYNATFTATQPMRIGIVTLGYADGFLRSWAGVGALVHGSKLLPLLGRVSMDMVAVDLAAAPSLGEGDWVQVPYDLPVAAQQSTLSQYELLTVLGNRLRP